MISTMDIGIAKIEKEGSAVYAYGFTGARDTHLMSLDLPTWMEDLVDADIGTIEEWAKENNATFERLEYQFNPMEAFL